jgi:hypothetical protein
MGLKWRLHVPTGALVFVAAFLVYIGVAAVLVFGHHSIVGDAWSRVANAYYVLYSRDPHLAAMGFVWNPLPSMAMLPLLPLKAIWPALVTEGFAANVVSALFMAGAVAQFRAFLADLRLPRLIGPALVLLFAAHPMIVLYGANGMSEAPFLFFLVVGAHQLSKWIERNDSASLAYSGVAIAFAYLTRYEAAAAALFAAVVVALVSFQRAPAGSRRITALSDVLIFSAPPAFAFASWAFASWVIVGTPFETFTSMYGNAAQVERASTGIVQATGQGTLNGVIYAGAQLLALAPLVVPIATIALLAALRRRDARLLGPLAVFGGVLGFAFAAFISGSSFGWLRFYITLIPLMAAIAALAVAAAVPAQAPSSPAPWRRWFSRLSPYAMGLLMVGMLAVGYPSVVAGMVDDQIGRGEAREQLTELLPGTVAASQYSEDAYLLAGEVADHVDGLNLGVGAVLTDAANAFPIIMRSGDPRQFVITPDRDFQAILANPVQFGVLYVLVPSGDPGHDAVTRAYPGMYSDGAGVAQLVGEFTRGPFAWRLYRLDS